MFDSLRKRLVGRDVTSRDVHGSMERLIAAVGELTATQRKQAEQLKHLRDAQKEADNRWRAALRSLEKAQKTERKWRVIFARQVDAVLRHLQLARVPLPAPYDITARRFRLRSQNEEDGVILALLERATWTNRRFVEIGSGRSGGNAALLAYECGWSGLMIDVEPAAIEAVRQRFGHNPGVVGVLATVSPNNINQLLRTHGFSGEVDLLSIDIDSYDYWVLEALTECNPRLLVVEYNAAFGPERAVTVPLDYPLADAPKAYRGASLTALEKLARRKGYRLVACEPSGVNAFFLRNDVAPDVRGLSVSEAFRPAISRLDLDDAPRDPDMVLSADVHPLVEV